MTVAARARRCLALSRALGLEMIPVTARVGREPRLSSLLRPAGTSTGLSLSVSARRCQAADTGRPTPQPGRSGRGDGLRVGGPPSLPHKAMHFLR